MTSLLFVGDFSPQGRLAAIHSMSPSEVFGSFLSKIEEVDLAVLNLESPLCKPVNPIAKTGPSLHGAPEVAEFIAKSGFGLACLANNHIMDYGCVGLESTVRALERAGVAWTGAGSNRIAAGSPFIFEKSGKCIGIVNIAENEWSTTSGPAPGANPLDPIANYRAIRECKNKVDHVIVVSHGGHEMHPLPSPRMKELFRFFVDAGADAVINHHSHCSSGYEIYKGAPIFFSLGNFLFDNPNRAVGVWTKGIAVELRLNASLFDFEIFHFDQCTGEKIFSALDGAQVLERSRYIDELNKVIANDSALEESFQKLVLDREIEYRSYLEPKISRFISGAQRRRWFPSFVSARQKRLLINLMRCEAHRELVIKMLEADIGEKT